MGVETIHGEGELLFDAELRPNRSLSAKGFRILMTALCLLSLVVGLACFLQGAWPVLVFLNLGVLALYLALRLNYRSGRLTETVKLSREELSIHRFQPGGRWRRWSFQPYWARVSLESDATDASGDPFDDIGSHGSVLVSSHGRGVHLGRFLAPEERQSFADALGGALRRLGRH